MLRLNRKMMLRMAASALMAFAMMPVADAQTVNTPEPAGAPTAQVHPWKQCAAQNNIALPARGSGQKLSDADKETIHTCVRAARKAAWQQCSQTAGFVAGQGQKPTDEQRQKIRTCMNQAGFHRHGRGRGEQQQVSAQPAN